MVTMNWPSGQRVPGSCGFPVPGLAVRIVDANGRDVEPNQEGELIVRGPNVMPGYHNKPEETRNALRAGWYHTGDLAKSDENGFLTITGRLKELIIRGGQNIAPAEIEEVVNTFAPVLDCAVVGLPHEHLGEVPALSSIHGASSPRRNSRSAMKRLDRDVSRARTSGGEMTIGAEIEQQSRTADAAAPVSSAARAFFGREHAPRRSGGE